MDHHHTHAGDLTRSWAAPAVRPEPGKLDSVDIYITGLCNRRCEYCFLSAEFLDSARHMSDDEYDSILRWVKSSEIPEVTLLGGEASLHPNFAEFVDRAVGADLKVRVVTNGHKKFRSLIESGRIDKTTISRVAVSLDTSSDLLQDRLRGKRATDDASATIAALKNAEIPFDINVTGLQSVMSEIAGHVASMCGLGARRVNIHWPSTIGMGSGISPSEIPSEQAWTRWVEWVEAFETPREDFFVEIERGFLSDSGPLSRCAVTDMSNLQVFPGGATFRCGLLVDRPQMSSLTMDDGELRPSSLGRRGEQAIGSIVEAGCDSCPLAGREGRRACIYDKVTSSPT